jgi:hypothetical protein
MTKQFIEASGSPGVPMGEPLGGLNSQTGGAGEPAPGAEGLTRHPFRPFSADAFPGTDPSHPPYGHGDGTPHPIVEPESQPEMFTDPTISLYAREENRRALAWDGIIVNAAEYEPGSYAGMDVIPTADTADAGQGGSDADTATPH